MDHYSAMHAVVAHIESHIREPLDADSLCALTGYSLSHLREIFLKNRSITLSRYLLLRRISHAAFDILQSDKPLTEIAMDYRFGSYDSFTRAFRRVTGYAPGQFRKLRPAMERRMLGIGIFGVAQAGKNHIGMNYPISEAPASSVLYGVPRVFYGAYGGVTPYPICLKACAAYLGTQIDYSDAICGSGAAFRLTWNTVEWDGGNVDVIFTFDGDERNEVYARGMQALGHSYKMLPRTESRTKEKIKAFLREALDDGFPVIAMGMVGPPEAGIVTGYREGGDTFLGWSVFQEYPDYNAGVQFDECGYYVTDRWHENGVDTLIAMGPKAGVPFTPEDTARIAVRVMQPRMEGPFAKGLLAYNAWLEALESPSFPTIEADGDPGAILSLLPMPLMCVADAVDCLCDGRYNAAKYFRRFAPLNPLYEEAACHFSEAHRLGMDMYKVLGGWERGERQLRALADAKSRASLCELIRRAKAEDTQALDCLSKISIP